MSKIAVIGSPAHGHVNPTLPVVQELVARAEQVGYQSSTEWHASGKVIMGCQAD